jgi:hypothetical protein
MLSCDSQTTASIQVLFCLCQTTTSRWTVASTINKNITIAFFVKASTYSTTVNVRK